MNAVLNKLKIDGFNPVLIMNAPEEYKDTMKEIPAEIHTQISGKYGFIQFFAVSAAEAEKYADALTKAIEGDGYLWICYPKGTSKKYKSDINRNRVLEIFGPYNFEGVTQIAIDDDWSALRVRDVDRIKTMKRKTAMSQKGRERIGMED